MKRAPGTSKRRWPGPVVASLTVGAALLASCATNAGTAATIVTTTTRVTSTAAPAATEPATTSSVADDLPSLPAAPPATGEAPVRLAEEELPVNYLEYDAWHSYPQEPQPPDRFGFDLNGCSLAGPGVVVYDLTLPDTVDYPLVTFVAPSVLAGDMADGVLGLVTFEQSGRQLLVASLPDQVRPYELAGEQEIRNDRGGNEVDRQVDWAESGMECQLEFGDGAAFHSQYLELADAPQALAATAPEGTIERLAQVAFEKGPDAALLPLAIAYGEAIRFYSDVWFIPEHPDRLLSIHESLDDGGCLELESRYDSYTIIQSRDCPSPAQSAVWQAGTDWFAAASDGTWVVTVSGADESLVVDTLSSLGAYRHLFSREIPLQPVNEEVMGRAPFGTGEVLVTFGEQRCSSSCRSPENWFYVYRIEDGALEQIADYPGYGQCLLAEEDEFVLAVAPRFGSIRVDEPASSDVITAEEDKSPFFFASTEDGPFQIAVLDENGNEAGCVAQLRADGRGGVEPPTVTTTPAPVAIRTVVAAACTKPNPDLAEFTDEDPIRQACVDTDFGELTVSLVVPNDMLVEPPDDTLRCLVEQNGNGAGAGCSNPDGSIDPLVSGSEDFISFSTLVPDGTNRIVAMTSRGAELIGSPFDGLATIWWLPAEGDLRQVTAETDTGPVTLYPTE